MEIVIVVGLLVAVGVAVAFTLFWQRMSRMEARQAAMAARQEATEIELGHGPAHDAARGSAPLDLRQDKTVLGRLRAVELIVLVSRRRRSAR